MEPSQPVHGFKGMVGEFARRRDATAVSIGTCQPGLVKIRRIRTVRSGTEYDIPWRDVMHGVPGFPIVLPRRIYHVHRFVDMINAYGGY